MKPIPVVFHLGPLQIHTYGIGLALTFWFGYQYFVRRCASKGEPTEWVAGAFLWIVVAAIVGARVVSVVANLGYYAHNPGDILAVWHGGLSSFGGLAFAIPTGLFLAHRRCPELGVARSLDLVAPVLMAAWGVGRLLGPQLMIDGGGHPTHAWYGMAYAGQVGERIPVPLFQSAESFGVCLVLLALERRVRNAPPGFLFAGLAALWGVTRFFDEYFWLAVPRLWDAVEAFSLLLSAVGLAVMAIMWSRHRHRRLGAPALENAGGPAEPALAQMSTGQSQPPVDGDGVPAPA